MTQFCRQARLIRYLLCVTGGHNDAILKSTIPPKSIQTISSKPLSMYVHKCTYIIICKVFHVEHISIFAVLGLGGLGVDGVFKVDIDLVAEGGQGLTDGAGGQLQHRGGLDADGGHAPRLQVLFEVDDHAVAVKVDGVDREAHGEGVDAMGGVDPKALAARETGGVGSHESAKTGPVGPGDHEIGREIGGAGAVEGEAPGAARRHFVTEYP